MTLRTWIILSVVAIAALIVTAHAEFSAKTATHDKNRHSLTQNPAASACK